MYMACLNCSLLQFLVACLTRSAPLRGRRILQSRGRPRAFRRPPTTCHHLPPLATICHHLPPLATTCHHRARTFSLLNLANTDTNSNYSALLAKFVQHSLGNPQDSPQDFPNVPKMAHGSHQYGLQDTELGPSDTQDGLWNLPKPS